MIITCFRVKFLKDCFIRYTTRNLKRNCVRSVLANLKLTNVYRYNSRIIYELKRFPRYNFGHKFHSVPTVPVLLLTTLWYEISANDDVEDNLAHLVTLAKYAIERGDIPRAEDILRLGLKICEEHKLFISTAYLYDILTTLALSQGKIKDAENLLVTAIEKLAIWGFPDNHYHVIDFKLRLARIYSASGQNVFAKLGFEKCLDHQRLKIENGDTSEKTGLLYIHILFWYGVHMIRNSMYDEARSMLRTAYDYSTKVKGLTPKQEMVILYTLADLNSELGDLNNALALILDAIVLGKGIGSVDMPICYMKLGGIYQQIGFYDLAKLAYEEALKSASTFGYFDIVIDAENALKSLNNDNNNKPKRDQ